MIDGNYAVVLGMTAPFRRTVTALMSIWGLGEGEAKTVASCTPVLIAEGVSKARAEEIKGQFAAFGVEVEMGQGNIESKAVLMETILANRSQGDKKRPKVMFSRFVAGSIVLALLFLAQFYLRTALVDKIVFGVGLGIYIAFALYFWRQIRLGEIKEKSTG